MVHIYTFCDKTLIGRKECLSSKFLCQNLYKLNFKIQECSTFSYGYDFQSINLKNKHIYFLLMQKPNIQLNEYLAGLCGCSLKENNQIKNQVFKFIKSVSDSQNLKLSNEWTIPEKAKPILNNSGVQQGYFITLGEANIFVLPNEYQFIKQMFYNSILTTLENCNDKDYKSETYKTFGLTEEHLKKLLEENIKNKNKVSVSIFSNGLDNDVVIKAKANNQNFDVATKDIYAKLQKYIYSCQGFELEEYLNKLLLEKNVKVCFGGDSSISGVMSSISAQNFHNNVLECIVLPTIKQASKFVKNSIQNQSLNNSESAYEIAIKLLNLTEAELCVVSTLSFESSGRATAYVAIGNKVKIDIYKNNFFGASDEILKNASKSVIFYLIKKLLLNDCKVI